MFTYKNFCRSALFAALACGAPALAPAADATLERLRADGDVARAKTELLRELLADPKSQASLFNLGSIAERERDWPAAIDFYTRAAQLAPQTELGRSAEARLAAVRRIAALNASPAGRDQLRYEVTLARAAEARGSNQLAAAQAALEAALRIAPERWEAPAMLGAVLSEQGRLDDAAGYIRMARRNAPAAERERFHRALDALLNPSRHLFDSTFQAGGASAAATQKAVRELLPARGGERIKEAAALLVARDIDAAVVLLAESLEADDADAALAWRMLGELAAVAPAARLAIVNRPEPEVAALRLDNLLPNAISDEIESVAAAPPLLVEQTQSLSAQAAPPLADACLAPTAPVFVPAVAPAVAIIEAEPTPAAAARLSELQVAAYVNSARADALARTLAGRGYQAEARREGQVFRVMVGPFASDATATQARRRLEQEGFPGLLRSKTIR